MNWEDDFDFTNTKKASKLSGKQEIQSPNSTENLLDFDSAEKPIAPIRTRKSGGWADESNKSAKKKTSTNLIEQERFQSNNKSESDDDIPIIPDIEDLQEEPIHLQDAKIASTVNKQTYKDLDSELKHLQNSQASFGKTGDINLSFLTNRLYSEKEVKDPDVVWTMESLFNNLKSSRLN